MFKNADGAKMPRGTWETWEMRKQWRSRSRHVALGKNSVLGPQPMGLASCTDGQDGLTHLLSLIQGELGFSAG